jgi:hypothetical protein
MEHKSIVIALPIKEGKLRKWKEFISELNTRHFSSYQESKRKFDVSEKVYLQETTTGEYIAVMAIQGKDPKGALEWFSVTNSPFVTWYAANFKEIFGVDITDYHSLDNG